MQEVVQVLGTVEVTLDCCLFVFQTGMSRVRGLLRAKRGFRAAGTAQTAGFGISENRGGGGNNGAVRSVYIVVDGRVFEDEGGRMRDEREAGKEFG